MDFWLGFTCPARFCELLPGELESGEIFLQNLIVQALCRLRLTTVVVVVELLFLVAESVYSVRVHMCCDALFLATPAELEAFKMETECVISQAMLQCFWEVRVSEY